MLDPSSTPPTVLPDLAALGALLDRLDAEAPKAVGVWLQPDPEQPKHVQVDPRRGGAAAVGIATDGVAFAGRFDGEVAEVLQAWLGGMPETYIVFHGAQDALLRLSAASSRRHPARTQKIGCTQTAAMLLAEGTRRGRDLPTLAECSEKLRGIPLDVAGLLADPIGTAGRHASALLPVMKALTPMLRKRDLGRVYRLETDVIPSVVAMERAGLAVDAAGFERISGQWQAERVQTEDPARIARLDKLISTYGYWGREHIRGGRIHCRLHPLATDSGRFSCTDPNLQQVPSNHTAPGLRDCFAAPESMRLVIADYAQIELRVAAHLAPCDAMRQVFREGRDPHRATAATITGKSEADITTHERKLAKAVNFGFLFGMGAARFRSYAADGYGVALSDREAADARAAFLATFPGIARWHKQVGGLSRRPGPVTVRTALGRRKRFVPGKVSFNAALNIPVQGTAAEGFKRAMVALDPALRELGGRGVMVVHDEYIAEVPEARGAEGRALVAEIMKTSMASVVTTVPIEVEAELRSTWG
ncbi:MAG: DNA polymerase [Myxococcota bacterium]